jgi:hypothetical protein
MYISKKIITKIRYLKFKFENIRIKILNELELYDLSKGIKTNSKQGKKSFTNINVLKKVF